MKRLLMYLLFLVISTQMLGGTKEVSIYFELNETAINRAIVSQFNESNFPF